MCLVAVNWRPAADYPLLLIANRDEFRERPAAPMHWWQKPEMLAGQDLRAGGTWFAIDPQGRFAMVTNIRPGYVGKTAELSRGELPLRFIESGASISEFHAELVTDIGRYGGFNMLLGEPGALFWFSSDHPEGSWVRPGIHALCNDAWNTPWPKTSLAIEQMKDESARFELGDLSADILNSTVQFSDVLLPETGLSLEKERMLSAQMILGPDYGTRSRTWLRMRADGHIWVNEAQYSEQGEQLSLKSFDWSR